MKKILLSLLGLFLVVSICFAGQSPPVSVYEHNKHRETIGWHIHRYDTDIDGSAEQITTLATAYAQLASNDTLKVTSTDASDTSQTLTVIGIDSNGNRVTEDFSLNGTTAVSGSTTFKLYEHCILDAATSGDIKIGDATTNTTVSQIHAGSLEEGEAQRFSGEYTTYITSWKCGVTTTDGNILFELWWFPTDTDIRTPVDYIILDRMYIDAAATSPYNPPYSYSQPIKIPPNGAVAVYATGSAVNSDGFTTIQGYDMR